MVNVGIFVTIWNSLWPFGIICGRLLLFVVICYIFPVLVCLDQEKSGNPVVATTSPQNNIFLLLDNLKDRLHALANQFRE
jgi:hypothetical protein